MLVSNVLSKNSIILRSLTTYTYARCSGSDLLTSMHALQTEEVRQRFTRAYFVLALIRGRADPLTLCRGYCCSLPSASLSFLPPKSCSMQLRTRVCPHRPHMPYTMVDKAAAATMLGDPRLGKIAAGCYADLVVLDANPLEDVAVLDFPEDHLYAVIKEGQVVSSRLDGLQATPLI